MAKKEPVIHWVLLGTRKAVCGSREDFYLSVDPSIVTCMKCYTTRIAELKKQFTSLFKEK